MKHEDKKDEGFGRRDFLKSAVAGGAVAAAATAAVTAPQTAQRSEEHTSELQSH